MPKGFFFRWLAPAVFGLVVGFFALATAVTNETALPVSLVLLFSPGLKVAELVMPETHASLAWTFGWLLRIAIGVNAVFYFAIFALLAYFLERRRRAPAGDFDPTRLHLTRSSPTRPDRKPPATESPDKTLLCKTRALAFGGSALANAHISSTGGKMKKVFQRCLSAATIIAASLVLGSCNPPNYPTGTIELKYYAAGSWSVTVQAGAACCDSLGNKFDLYYPTNLGAGGFLHPIITWGNGTNGSAAQVDYLLRHFASWGFVVIATEDKTTGAGQTILDAANYMVAQNSNSASLFFHKLNVSQIGAVGHSQGAGGVINASNKSGGLIKTVIPIELPAQAWCILNLPTCADSKNLTSGSVFFIDGSADTIISPPTQSPGTIGEQSIAAYYNAVPAGVGKVKGTLKGPNHNDVTGQPACNTAQFPCVNGVYGYLGYPTAWLMFQLQGDSFAHGAFVSGTGEMFSETKNWEFVASNIP